MRFRVEVPTFKRAAGGGYLVTMRDLNQPHAEPTQIFARTLIDCTTSRYAHTHLRERALLHNKHTPCAL